ncbi:MAG: hypothetical protein V4727_02805 [Verrucomicrobiota bacterium]
MRSNVRHQKMEPFCIKFTCPDSERLEAAEKVFTRIQECKSNGEWPDDIDSWKPYFDNRALAHFWWPTDAELDDWKRRYLAAPVDKRHTDPSLEHPWDFLSMIDAFKNGEYELESFESAGAGLGMLTYEPFSHPFGGTGCMRAFIEAFDMTVTEETI